jgi:hypothetical protein
MKQEGGRVKMRFRCIRSKDMPQKQIVVMITGMELAEQERFAEKIRETIQKENRLNKANKVERIPYLINF